MNTRPLSPRPSPLLVAIASIPAELKSCQQFVCWSYEHQPERNPQKPWTKVPKSPSTGRNASSTNAKSWGTFKQACARYEKQKLDGIGFVLTEADPYVAIDLDGCRDGATGNIASWAQEIVDRFSTYTEVSPSGTGLRIFLKGQLPPGGRKKGSVEVYQDERYMTVTGHHLPSTPLTIEARQAELEAWHHEVFADRNADVCAPIPPASSSNGYFSAHPLADDAILERALRAANGAKFAQLWAGNYEGDYPSHSEADLALVCMLAFWCRDASQLDGLFRRSGLMRKKWDANHGEDTYGDITIRRALARVTESYSPNGRAHAMPAASGHGGRGVPPASGSPIPTDPGLDETPLSQLYNAEALVAAHGVELRYCGPWRRWLRYDGTRWQQDDTGEVMRLAVDTVKGFGTQLAVLNTAEAKEMSIHIKASLSARNLEGMIKLAQSRPGIPVMPDELDCDPWILNCENGTIDLRTGQLRPHRPEDLITRMIPVHYDAEARCPTWLRFLSEVMDSKQALIDYLQRAFGYSLTGSVEEQCLFFVYGSGQNGKSTFLLILLWLLNTYAMQAVAELLMVRSSEQHPTERADLFGKRFVATIEVESGKRLAESLVKQLTGGDRIRARRMREDFWEFNPTHKIWLAANHKPIIRGQDQAIWRRIRLIPFTVTIPEEKKDKTLPDKLRSELPGILAWAVRGCLEWQRIGLAEPDEVIQATKAYRAEMDTLSQFLEECCLVRPEQPQAIRTRSSTLYEAFCRWSGEHPTQKEFSGKFAELGYAKKMGGDGSMYWLGVGLVVDIKDRLEAKGSRDG